MTTQKTGKEAEAPEPETDDVISLTDIVKARVAEEEPAAETPPEDTPGTPEWDKKRQERDQELSNREKALSDRESDVAKREREAEDLRRKLAETGAAVVETDEKPVEEEPEPDDLVLPDTPDADDLAVFARAATKRIKDLEAANIEARQEIQEIQQTEAYETNKSALQKAIDGAVEKHGEDHRAAITEGVGKAFTEELEYEAEAVPNARVSKIVVDATVGRLGLGEEKPPDPPKDPTKEPEKEAERLDTSRGGTAVTGPRVHQGGSIASVMARMKKENPDKYITDEDEPPIL